MNAYEMIKNEIIIGKLPPGKRLTEEALAERFQVSRTPVREAIKQLESDGLITPFQRRGYTVREFTIQDIRQIYDVRALLESYGTSEAALYRTEEDLEKIHNKNLAYEKAINDLDREDIYSILSLQQANQAFHEEIYKATKNEYLMSLISKVVVVPLIFRSFYWYNENQLIRSLDVHNTIWKAIANQEPERAKIAMQEHIYQGRDDVLKQLSNPELEIWKENAQ